MSVCFKMKKMMLLFFVSFCFAYSLSQETEEISSILFNQPKNHEYTIAEIKVKGAEVYGYEQNILANMSGLSIGEKVTIPDEKITTALKAFLKRGLFSWGKVVISKQISDSIWLEFILQPTPIISDMIFVGIKKSEEKILKSKIGFSCNQQLTQNFIDFSKKQIKDFFENKGFSQVDIRVQYRDDSINDRKIIVDFFINKKKLRIKNINIIGNNQFSNYTLKKTMKKTKENSFLKKPFISNTFLQNEYKKDLEKIVLKYNEQGYCDASIVSDSIIFNSDKNIDINLYINEGKQYKIRNIQWIGNTLYSSDKLNHILKISAGDIYNQKKLQARLFYDEDAVAALYYNNGYFFSSINPLEVCIENNFVDLEIRIIEGLQSTINKVIINGNKKVHDNVIRRELATKPGQLFSKKAIVCSAEKIAQMGYFDPTKIDIQSIPNSESNMVDILYNLTYKANDQMELSAGYGKAGGLVGRVSLKLSNFSFQNVIHWDKYKNIIPQGDGQSLILSCQTNGHNCQSYNISFLEPWFGGKQPNIFSLNTSCIFCPEVVTDSITTDDPNKCTTTIFGISAGYGKHLNCIDNYSILTSNISYRKYWLKNFELGNNVNNLNLGFTYNRNSIYNLTYPQYGSIFSLSVNATPPYSLFGKKHDISYSMNDYSIFRWMEYHKWEFKEKKFFPLTKLGKNKRTPVLMNSIECGYLAPYNSKKCNPFETFDMGGSGGMSNYYSTVYNKEIIGLRGYEAEALNPEGGGYAYSRLIFEIRYQLILDQQTTNMYGLLFLEAGNAWGKNVKIFHSFKLKRSAGIGIRLMLPMVGSIGFDWAYGFDKPNKSNKISGWQFHFVLGQEI